ncbi:translation initiation factor IF-3 [candidate division Kazan bacterium RBG_13_50_9]|uniref:Translation initiation factor IF-3 n=1 Tax=candidate division Kazan bacterium RBG_13_50_9 TaxID=1798535 RepID=A0A1F4NSI3_UNCK3|nr:MAG: translation initiation factor IF-3 [candidate division Kazan bacterium RBG_13_50_9]
MPPNKRTRVNQQIRLPQVLLIDEAGKRVGVVPTPEALRRAQEAELDLVEVAPNLRPPVCKILDFGKYQYDIAKSQADQRKKQKGRDIKEMRLGLKIDDHDLMVKSKKVSQFLERGHKVKINLKFRGREIAHRELGSELLERFLVSLTTKHMVEKAPIMQGKQLIIVIAPVR